MGLCQILETHEEWVKKVWYDNVAFIFKLGEYMSTQVSSECLDVEIEKLLLNRYPKWLEDRRQYAVLYGVGYSVISTLVLIIASLVFHRFDGNPNITDLTEDVGLPFVQVICGAFVYYYLKLPALLAKTFKQLVANDVFDADEIIIDKKWEKNLQSRRWNWLAWSVAIFSIIAMALHSGLNADKTDAWNDHWSLFLIAQGCWLIAWYTGPQLILNVFLSALLVAHIFKKNEIQVHRLHRDGCGGFSPLSKFSLHVTYFALIYGIGFFVSGLHSYFEGNISKDYLLFLDVSIYLVIVPIIFYLPLHSAHKAMLNYRHRLINKTSEKYLHEHSSLYNSSYDDLEDKLKVLDGLKQLRDEHEQAYPVWPFNIRIRLAVLLNALFPVTTTLIGLFIDVVK
jgi:hypothetical protein